jgi:hypothetical protein
MAIQRLIKFPRWLLLLLIILHQLQRAVLRSLLRPRLHAVLRSPLRPLLRAVLRQHLRNTIPPLTSTISHAYKKVKKKGRSPPNKDNDMDEKHAMQL